MTDSSILIQMLLAQVAVLSDEFVNKTHDERDATIKADIRLIMTVVHRLKGVPLNKADTEAQIFANGLLQKRVARRSSLVMCKTSEP